MPILKYFRRFLNVVLGARKPLKKEYRHKMSHVMQKLYSEMTILERIKILRLGWLGHVSRNKTKTPAINKINDKYAWRTKDA